MVPGCAHPPSFPPNAYVHGWQVKLKQDTDVLDTWFLLSPCPQLLLFVVAAQLEPVTLWERVR